MKADVIMPQMGESIAEGTITKWLKRPGETVKRDEPLFEMSTDKVDAEIPSPAEGVLSQVLVGEGETVPIQTVVAIIETEKQEPLHRPAVQSSPQPEGKKPHHDDGDRWSASVQPTFPAPAPSPHEFRGADREIAVTSRPWEKIPQEVTIRLPRPEAPSQVRPIRSSPVVQKLAQEYGIDLSRIQGTGIKGRITKRDIMSFLENQAASPTISGPVPPPAIVETVPAPASAGENIEIVPMSVMRKKIAEHMVMSKRTSAHVSTVFEIDMTRISKLRELMKADFQQRHGVNLTYLPFILKACAEALQAYPILNASVVEDKIAYRKDINIGVAVALDWGLIVPVVRNADEKSLVGLAKAVADLAARARAKQLKPEEVQGGTFTVTNPGLFGSLFGTPIINQPQVAILGVGHITKRPVVVENDAIAIRSMVYFTLTFDHRIIDGSVADQFMSHVKRTLEKFDVALE